MQIWDSDHRQPPECVGNSYRNSKYFSNTVFYTNTDVNYHSSVSASSESATRTVNTSEPAAITAQDIVSLEPNDYIEVWVANDDGNQALTVESLSLIAIRLAN